MFAVAWYAWVAIVLVVVVLLFVFALLHFRAGVRRELIAFLAEEYPDVEVRRSRVTALEIRSGEVTATWFLGKVYHAVAELGGKNDTPKNRRKIFREFADEIIGGLREAGEPLTLNRHGKRILVRLVTPDWLASLPAGHSVPNRPVEGLDLRTAYVLDSPGSVRYLTDADLADLGLDLEGVHKLALDNLRSRSSPDVVANVLRDNNMVSVKALDSYDAARLMLVPEQLREGDELIALVPDRDTLTLVPVPPDRDFGPLRQLARIPASEHLLLDRPVRVRRGGFEVV
jgi:hypothetical protein